VFHCASQLYRPGDRVVPGNWGRLIFGRGPDHPHFYREYLFERIRQAEFADRPSRMQAAFAHRSVDDATGYCQPGEYVYAVEVTTPEAPSHLADMRWLTIIRGYRSFDGIEDVARHYWSGDEPEGDPNGWELVTYSELVVLRRITPIPENGQ